MVEVNDVRFETVMKKRALAIPKKQPGAFTPVQFGVRVTNLYSTPYRFNFYRLLPEFLDKDKEVMLRGGGIARAAQFTEADFQLVLPGESFTHLKNAKLFWLLKDQIPWLEDRLQIDGHDGKFSLIWSFKNFQQGTYQVRFTYQRESSVGKISMGSRYQIVCTNMWTGSVSTPWVQFRLKY